MKKIVIGLLLFCAASMAWALPTLQEVEAQTKAGHFAQAENMMAEVVAAKPGSAKAHYIYAEILAHNASFSKASTEAAKARELDPKIGFTDPDKFRGFEQTLQRELNPPARPRATTTERPMSSLAPTQVQAVPAETRSPGIPGWVWVGGLVLVGIVVWKMMSRSKPQPGMSNALATAGGQGGYGAPGGFGPGGPGAGGAAMGSGYGPGYGPGGAPMGRPGGGLLGTGLAVAGGVAGGMLIDEMLHKRGNDGGGASSNIGGFDPNGYQPGGDSAARDLADRPVDFGNGGDWDSGGSSDSGGGDSGGGGWD